MWQTRDGGQNWKQISPDLTRKTFEIPASVGKFRSQPTAQPRQRGVIYTVAPSPLDKNRIWAGTDDGLIHLTTDGGQELDRRDAAANRPVVENLADGRESFRREDTPTRR